MKVLMRLTNGDMVEFEINEVGVLGVGNYFLKDGKGGVPINPSVSDVVKWLNEGKVINIRFANDNEKKALIRTLLEYRQIRSLSLCEGFWKVVAKLE